MDYNVKHTGIFGANVYTLTKHSGKGEEYAAFHDSDLFNDIRSLLEAHGYIVSDIFFDFKEEEPCNETDVMKFEKYKLEGQNKAKQVYSKANVKRFYLE